ncbi:MAG: signal peptide peptidase SppA [Phycisphaerales bacterium]|nr:signal peptide peptidase SppA [Phycisphaerales bacterium]
MRFPLTTVAALAVGLLTTPVPSVAGGFDGAPPKTDQAGKGAARVGLIELNGPLTARHAALGIGGVPGETTLADALGALEKAGSDPSTRGVVIRLKDAELTATGVEELGAGVDRLRKAGRKVHLYAESYATPEVVLGSHCDEVILQTGGRVSLPGVYMEELFLADAFKWAGVTPDFVQIGDYKGAQEMYANAKPSPQWDQNINALLDALYGQVRRQVGAGRKLSDKQLDAAMEQAWMADGKTARAAGLIDAEIDLPDLNGHLERAYGGPIEWDDRLLADPREAAREKMSGSPLALLGTLFSSAEYKPRRATIAVLHIDGAIADGESGRGGPLSRENEVGSRTIKRTIEDLIDDPRIKGVVLRIDSPGGSAVASEMIWQSVKRLRQSKPVYVSVGGMAASGGYYIAVSGERIYLNPSSIVGSIGVVGGKVALGGAYEKLHINVVPRSRGPHAAVMGGSATPWTEQERALVRRKMTETYELFSSRVAAGRTGIDLARTAEGRLFVGQQAINLKMADRLGGFEAARDDLAKALNLPPGGYDVMDYPAPESFVEAIGGALRGLGAGVGAPSSAASAPSPLAAELRSVVRSLVGPANEARLTDAMSALWQLRQEPVILAAPRVLIFK